MNKFLNNYFLLSSFIIIILFSACKQFERVFIFKNNETEIKQINKQIIFNAEFVDINPNNQIIEYGHVWSSVRPIPLLSKDRFSKNGVLDAPKAFKTDFLMPALDSAYFVRAYAINSANDTLYTNIQTAKLNLSEILEIVAISSVERGAAVVKVAIDLESIRYKYPNYNGNIDCTINLNNTTAPNALITSSSLTLENVIATNNKIYATLPLDFITVRGLEAIISSKITFTAGTLIEVIAKPKTITL